MKKSSYTIKCMFHWPYQGQIKDSNFKLRLLHILQIVHLQRCHRRSHGAPSDSSEVEQEESAKVGKVALTANHTKELVTNTIYKPKVKCNIWQNILGKSSSPESPKSSLVKWMLGLRWIWSISWGVRCYICSMQYALAVCSRWDALFTVRWDLIEYTMHSQ